MKNFCTALSLMLIIISCGQNSSHNTETTDSTSAEALQEDVLRSGSGVWPDIEKLDRTVQQIVENSDVPGVSVLIAKDGEVILDKGYGFSNLTYKIPATSKTKYYSVAAIGTMSASIFQLIEQNKLSLEDNVYDIISGMQEQYKKVKVRHLLSLTSGVPDYHYLGDKFYFIPFPLTIDDIIGLFSELPLNFEPGSQFDWSISNFLLLAKVVEMKSGQSYQDYFQENFIKKLNLSETVYLDPKHVPVMDMATGYETHGNEFVIFRDNLYKYGPGLQFATTTGDMYKYWKGLSQGALISPEHFALMTDSLEKVKNNSFPFGYGAMSYTLNNHSYIVAGGTLNGYSGTFLHSTKDDHTIIVFANARGGTRIISSEISKYLLSPGNYELPMKNNEDEPESLPLTQAMIENYPGTYIVKPPKDAEMHETYKKYNKQTCRVYQQDNKLWLQLSILFYPRMMLLQEDGSFVLESNKDFKVQFKKEQNNYTIFLQRKNFQFEGPKTASASGNDYLKSIGKNMARD